MKNITIPIEIPAEILFALNNSEEEFKEEFLANTAASLYHKGKLSLGQAIKLSGIDRYGFEQFLAKKQIPVSNLSLEQIREDIEKRENLQNHLI